MTVEEMINFNTNECVTLLRQKIEAEIINGVYTVSRKSDLDFNEEEIKKMLLMFKPMQKELRVYNDAYKMACRELGYANKEKSTESWNNYFLQKAREQE